MTASKSTHENRTHHVIGGGTFSHIRSHMALAAPAFGETARAIQEDLRSRGEKSELHLTKMADPADPANKLVTDKDVAELVGELVADPTTKIIVFNPAIVDFHGQIGDVPSGKYAERLKSREAEGASIQLTPADKIVGNIRKDRKDIYLVAFKTTTGATPEEQYAQGLRLLKQGHVNLVLANDTKTRLNMVIVPEEARYFETTDRAEALKGLMDIALKRSKLDFTRSTVLKDAPRVAWNSNEVPQNLREVVNHLIARGAYKPFLGKTAGHFAARGQQLNEFLTSARGENFQQLPEKGLVRVFAQGADEVVAWGARPSVGGQSQRIVFATHPDADCIAHFHSPVREEHARSFPTRLQWLYECGSHQCGQNTADGLEEIRPGIRAVMLDNHGPNIVFGKDVPAGEVIEVIEKYFDVPAKTGGAIPVAYRNAPAPV